MNLNEIHTKKVHKPNIIQKHEHFHNSKPTIKT